jgi:hypothetical protein
LHYNIAKEATWVTVLADGDAGLWATQQQVAPHADHILDWFHLSMRFNSLEQIAKDTSTIAVAGIAPMRWQRSTARSGISGMATPSGPS